MVRAEARYRAKKAIYSKERSEKLGNYYRVRWNLKDRLNGNSPLTVSFNYTQPSTGRKIKTIQKTVSAARKGDLKLQIIGDKYLENGRILSWKTEIRQKGQVIAKKQSFLWE